jgi:hypothetical protein
MWTQVKESEFEAVHIGYKGNMTFVYAYTQTSWTQRRQDSRENKCTTYHAPNAQQLSETGQWMATSNGVYIGPELNVSQTMVGN